MIAGQRSSWSGRQGELVALKTTSAGLDRLGGTEDLLFQEPVYKVWTKRLIIRVNDSSEQVQLNASERSSEADPRSFSGKQSVRLARNRRI